MSTHVIMHVSGNSGADSTKSGGAWGGSGPTCAIFFFTSIVQLQIYLDSRFRLAPMCNYAGQCKFTTLTLTPCSPYFLQSSVQYKSHSCVYDELRVRLQQWAIHPLFLLCSRSCTILCPMIGSSVSILSLVIGSSISILPLTIGSSISILPSSDSLNCFENTNIQHSYVCLITISRSVLFYCCQ